MMDERVCWAALDEHENDDVQVLGQLHQQDHLVDVTALHGIDVEGPPLMDDVPLLPLSFLGCHAFQCDLGTLRPRGSC